MVVTRAAPSPTGFVHIGNLRSFLYSYLIARNNNGKFILRIEDTDKAREVNGAVKAIFDLFKQTGLNFDDYAVQSSRKNIYYKYATDLVENNKAYYCFCQNNEEECKCRYNNYIYNDIQNKNFVIRFKMPKQGRISFHDEVFGNIEVDNETLEDVILIKTDGFPTYNFAHIIDDYLMGVTHVVRGSEYLASTPKYVNIYKAFDWKIPFYVHLPLIMGRDENGNVSKLSKRHGAVSFSDLIAKGYLPEAILNYIAFLGWNPKTNKEIYSLEELKKDFSIKKINKAPAVFDYVKLDWFNKQYYGKMSKDDFYNFITKFEKNYFNLYGSNFYDLTEDKKKYFIELIRTRISNLESLENLINFFIRPKPTNINDYYINGIDNNLVVNILSELSEFDWNINTIEDAKNALNQITNKLNLKIKQVAWVARIALTSELNTPGGATDMLYLYNNLKHRFRIAYNYYLKHS
jgi:glutamyl-tRNA synthetase